MSGELQELITGGIGFLFGGASVALYNYVKFNGRLINITAQFKAHVEHEKEWQARVDRQLTRIETRIVKLNGDTNG